MDGHESNWTVTSQNERSRVKTESKWSQNERSMKLNWSVETAKIIRRLKIKLDGLVKWTVQDHKVVGLNGEKWTAQRIKTGRSFQIKVDGPLEHHREWQDIKPFTLTRGYWVPSSNKANFFVIFVATYTCRIILLVISSTSKISDPEDRFSIFFMSSNI